MLVRRPARTRGRPAQSCPRPLCMRLHVLHHLPLGDTHPAMATTVAVGNRPPISRLEPNRNSSSWWTAYVEKDRQRHRPDANLALKLGPTAQFCSSTRRRSYAFQCAAAPRLITVLGSRETDGPSPRKDHGGVQAPGRHRVPDRRQYVSTSLVRDQCREPRPSLRRTAAAIEAVPVDVRIAVLINIH